MSKNAHLGREVHKHLVSMGLETPMINNGLSTDEKIDKIEGLMEQVMNALGLDLEDDSLAETPHRIAKMYVKEIFSGLDYENFPKCTTVENKMAAEDEFVAVKNIKVTSTCEHHFLPFIGTGSGYAGAIIAYIPKEKVIGLSKLSRLVEFFARRPQIQERLTRQIAESLKYILGIEDVAVYIDAIHTCMTTRGVNDTGASTVTCAMSGKFLQDDNIRKEFLSLAKSMH